MDELITLLEQIYALLEQVSVITTNQTTILLQSQDSNQEDERALDMIEDMVGYKDELIIELTSKEQVFEQLYQKHREKMTDPHYAKSCKSLVERIMGLKTSIVEAERNNVLMMQSFVKKKEKQMILPKNPNTVAAAYKKQQART